MKDIRHTLPNLNNITAFLYALRSSLINLGSTSWKIHVYDGKFSAINWVKLASSVFVSCSSWLLLETGNLKETSHLNFRLKMPFECLYCFIDLKVDSSFLHTDQADFGGKIFPLFNTVTFTEKHLNKKKKTYLSWEMLLLTYLQGCIRLNHSSMTSLNEASSGQVVTKCLI